MSNPTQTAKSVFGDCFNYTYLLSEFSHLSYWKEIYVDPAAEPACEGEIKGD